MACDMRDDLSAYCGVATRLPSLAALLGSAASPMLQHSQHTYRCGSGRQGGAMPWLRSIASPSTRSIWSMSTISAQASNHQGVSKMAPRSLTITIFPVGTEFCMRIPPPGASRLCQFGSGLFLLLTIHCTGEKSVLLRTDIICMNDCTANTIALQ